jgi:hypothetical protein
MTKKEIFQSVVATIILIALGLFLMFSLVSCNLRQEEKEFLDEVSRYDIIVVNGEEYETKNIVSVDIHEGGYSPDIIEIELTDGTYVKFPEDTYTLKGKKSAELKGKTNAE